LVEGLGEEDEVGTVVGGGFDVDAAEFDVVGVDELRFWVGGGVLPRMWVMVEKANRLENLRICTQQYILIKSIQSGGLLDIGFRGTKVIL
jgi:hypothetical protein